MRVCARGYFLAERHLTIALVGGIWALRCINRQLQVVRSPFLTCRWNGFK